MSLEGVVEPDVVSDDGEMSAPDVEPDVEPDVASDDGATVSSTPVEDEADPIPVSFMCEAEFAEAGPVVVPLAVDVSLIGATSLVVARVSLMLLWSAAVSW